MRQGGWPVGVVFTILISCLASFTVQASVTGSFTIGAAINPQTNSMEMVQTFADLRSQLIVNWEVSGLNAQADIAGGFTGIEHLVFGSSATLGNFHLSNQLAFASPFASISLSSFTFLIPIGPILFVTARAQASTRIVGVTLSNLAIFEDVNFKNPFATLPLGPLGTPVLPTYTAQSQAFRFGDIISLQGQIANSATLTMATGIGADPGLSRCVKGRCFSGAAVSNRNLALVRETISLQNLTLGPVQLGASLTFVQSPSVTLALQSLVVSAQFTIQSLGRVSASFTSKLDNLVSLASISLVTNSPPITISTSFTPALAISSTSVSGSFNLSPVSSVNLQASWTPTSGLTGESVSFFISLPAGVSFTTGISSSPSGPLLLTATVNAQLSSVLSFYGGVTILPTPATTQVNAAMTYRF